MSPRAHTLAWGSLAAAVAGLLVGGGCEQPASCEEDVRAQQLDEVLTLQIGAEALDVEVADSATERERGWMHRACDRGGLLLVVDMQEPLPIWGCGLVDPVDLHFVRDGEVVDVVRDVQPCGAPCNACPLYGEEVPVDAVVETLAGRLAADVGAPTSGLP